MTGFHRTGLPPASDGPLAHSDELTGLTPFRSIPIPFSHGLTPGEVFAAARLHCGNPMKLSGFPDIISVYNQAKLGNAIYGPSRAALRRLRMLS